MSRFLFFILFLVNVNVYAQEPYLKKAKELSKIDPTEAIIYVDSIIFNISDLNKNEFAEIKLYKSISYQKLSNFKKALSILNEIKITDFKSEFYVKTLISKSLCNLSLDNFSTATDQAIKALNIAEEQNYDLRTIKALNSLSYLHYSAKEYDKAFYYLDKSVKLLAENLDSLELSATYNNMAIIYKNIGNFDSALLFNNKSIEISKATNDQEGISKSYSNIGRVYDMIGDSKTAMLYFNMAEINNDKYHLVNSIPFRNKADLFFSFNKIKEAEVNYLKALRIEEKEGNSSKVFNLYSNLMKIAIKKNDIHKTMHIQKKLDSIQELKNKIENNEKIKILENQYKLTNNEKRLNLEKDINNKNKIIFIISFVLFLLLALYFFQKNKNNKLKLEQEKLRLEQKVLRSQMNPHFIFNVLSAIQNSLLDNDVINSATYLSRFAKLIRQNFDFINRKEISLKEEIDSLKNYLDTQNFRFNNKFNYSFEVNEKIITDDIEIPPLLLQPFIENAIEHAFKKKKSDCKILIKIIQFDNKICYIIKDNGNGFIKKRKDDKEHAIDIFRRRLKLREMNEEETFEIKSTEEGTEIKFCLKL